MGTKFSIIISAAFLFSVNAFSGPTKDVKDYSTKIREASEQFSKLAKQAQGDKDLIANKAAFKEICNQFKITGKDQSRIAQAIADGKTNVVTALFATMAAKELVDAHKIENNDMDQGILNLIKVASVSGKGAPMNASLKLSANEMAVATAALSKKTEYTIDMLSWGKEETDIHIAVMNKTAEIFKAEKVTPEEAYIMAIMEIKGCDKDTAMKIARRIKDCA